MKRLACAHHEKGEVASNVRRERLIGPVAHLSAVQDLLDLDQSLVLSRFTLRRIQLPLYQNLNVS